MLRGSSPKVDQVLNIKSCRVICYISKGLFFCGPERRKEDWQGFLCSTRVLRPARESSESKKVHHRNLERPVGKDALVEERRDFVNLRSAKQLLLNVLVQRL